MTLIRNAEPFGDMPTLELPHSWSCKKRPHPGRHCYREVDLEVRLVHHLAENYPNTRIARQEIWRGIGRPDLVLRHEQPWGWLITVIELKVVPVSTRAYNQLTYYIDYAGIHYDKHHDPIRLAGVMGAFWFRTPIPDRPSWYASWPMGCADA